MQRVSGTTISTQQNSNKNNSYFLVYNLFLREKALNQPSGVIIWVRTG